MTNQALLEWIPNPALFYLIIIGIAVNICFEVNFPKINRVVIESEKIPPDTEIKILQISDFHNWHSTDDHQKLLKKIRQLNPDLIVITGDLIDRKTSNFNNVYLLVQKLVKINRHTYFVCGNHEWARAKSQTQSFLSGLSDRGVQVLNNEYVVWNKEELSINICGVDYPDKKRASLDKATKDINTELFTLLLAHAPAIIDKPEITRTDLIICGHTHGGQVRLPFTGAIVAPNQGFFPAYDKGIYNIGSNTTLYIDSGLGTSALPVRFFNRSQISFIRLTGK